MKTIEILSRHPENPLITPDDIPGAMQVFNPSPVLFNDEIILLVSVVLFDCPYGGETRVARSSDGIHFRIDDQPFINLDKNVYPYSIAHQHVIDNRVTRIGDDYFILTPVATRNFDGPCTILGKTCDFNNYEVIDIVTLPRNRGASLFPEKINNQYFKLDRPGGGKGAYGAIWLSSSPDLVHWGRYRPLLAPFAPWGGTKIGPTPPIKTKDGWLVIIHGVHTPCDGPHYRIGALLLDLNDPCKIIGQTRSYLLAPEAEYEKNGVVDNVVFPCGAIWRPEKDELMLYYGGADTCICLASGSVEEILQACRNYR